MLLLRRTLIALSVAGLMVLPAATPAGAKPPAPGPGAVPSISAVVPVDTGATVTDMSGTFCVYDARVTATWTKTSRLNVYPVMNGVRMPPGETSLKGASTATVTVPFVLVPVAHSATFLAEMVVFQPRSGGYVLVASRWADRAVTCRR